MTALLGPQYRRSRDRIEIDITYACNLHCLNCNRSVTQAPESMHMSVAMIRDFVNQSLARRKRWRRIRVLGGEPTVHPQFEEIIGELLRYREAVPDCLVEVVSNGHGSQVEERLARLPTSVWVENSRKTSRIQPDFGPFNDAPIDDPKYGGADYRNGCAIVEDCGMGLTPLGYYPCAVAGGIERITGRKLARDRLPDDTDEMTDVLDSCCRLCGRFRDGHYVPRNLRPRLFEERISKSWEIIYARWKSQRRKR